MAGLSSVRRWYHCYMSCHCIHILHPRGAEILLTRDTSILYIDLILPSHLSPNRWARNITPNQLRPPQLLQAAHLVHQLVREGRESCYLITVCFPLSLYTQLSAQVCVA